MSLKENLTRPVTGIDLILFSPVVAIFIRETTDALAIPYESVDRFFMWTAGAMMLSAVGVIFFTLGLFILMNRHPVLFTKIQNALGIFSYIKSLPWWWYVGFMRDAKIFAYVQKMDEKIFSGKLPSFDISSKFFKEEEVVVEGEYVVTRMTKGECVYRRSENVVECIRLYGWHGMEQFKLTIIHEMAHAFQRWNGTLPDHGNSFEDIYKFFCIQMGVKPQFEYLKDDKPRTITWTMPKP